MLAQKTHRARATSRLLEEVASVANLAQALLKVIRNKGAPGVDGQTDQVVHQSLSSCIGNASAFYLVPDNRFFAGRG
jgi:hypothetical protein